MIKKKKTKIHINILIERYASKIKIISVIIKIFVIILSDSVVFMFGKFNLY